MTAPTAVKAIPAVKLTVDEKHMGGKIVHSHDGLTSTPDIRIDWEMTCLSSLNYDAHTQLRYVAPKSISKKKPRNAGLSNYVFNDYASILAYLALASMNARRGGTSSPISMEKV